MNIMLSYEMRNEKCRQCIHHFMGNNNCGAIWWNIYCELTKHVVIDYVRGTSANEYNYTIQKNEDNNCKDFSPIKDK